MLHCVALVRTDVSEERNSSHHQDDKNQWARNVSSNYQLMHAVKKYYILNTTKYDIHTT
jgi:hypothetical protein